MGPEGSGRKNFKIETQCNLVAVIVLPRISEYPLPCWRCMIVVAVSETASQYLLEEDEEE